MSKEQMAVMLTEGESVEIVTAHGTITIDSNGEASYDAGVYGGKFSFFGKGQNGIDPQSNGRHEPTKTEHINQYLYLLYEAQRSGHEVHSEIDEALKLFRKEAGF